MIPSAPTNLQHNDSKRKEAVAMTQSKSRLQLNLIALAGPLRELWPVSRLISENTYLPAHSPLLSATHPLTFLGKFIGEDIVSLPQLIIYTTLVVCNKYSKLACLSRFEFESIKQWIIIFFSFIFCYTETATVSLTAPAENIWLWTSGAFLSNWGTSSEVWQATLHVKFFCWRITWCVKMWR